MAEQAPFSFADGKDPQAFRTIGEVAAAFGIKQHVLRYWEEQFPMLRPLKRAGGRRYYRAEDVALVGEINRLLYGEGFTIRGARQALGGKRRPPEPVRGASDERPGEELERPAVDVAGDAGAKLRLVREQLAEALREG
jgi:DNA-binding transcriptional MerR regulator